MKDDEKVELRVGDIKRAAEKCGTAKEVLKEMFPKVFIESPPEWEDVTSEAKFYNYGAAEVVTLFAQGGRLTCPFRLVFNDHSTRLDEYKTNYKLEDGHIWRKKSQ